MGIVVLGQFLLEQRSRQSEEAGQGSYCATSLSIIRFYRGKIVRSYNLSEHFLEEGEPKIKGGGGGGGGGGAPAPGATPLPTPME